MGPVRGRWAEGESCFLYTRAHETRTGFVTRFPGLTTKWFTSSSEEDCDKSLYSSYGYDLEFGAVNAGCNGNGKRLLALRRASGAIDDYGEVTRSAEAAPSLSPRSRTRRGNSLQALLSFRPRMASSPARPPY